MPSEKNVVYPPLRHTHKDLINEGLLIAAQFIMQGMPIYVIRINTRACSAVNPETPSLARIPHPFRKTWLLARVYAPS